MEEKSEISADLATFWIHFSAWTQRGLRAYFWSCYRNGSAVMLMFASTPLSLEVVQGKWQRAGGGWDQVL